MIMNCIVTVNYNDYSLTQLFASKLAKYSCVDFVVIVDNNSTDNSVQELKKIENEKIAVVVSDVNGGYSYGNNLGYKFLKEKFGHDFNMIISNPDVEISEDETHKLFNSLNDESYGIVGPVIVEGEVLNRGWKNPTIGQEIILNTPFISKTIFKNLLKYRDDKYCSDVSEVDCVSGSIFAISSKNFEEIEMFDEGTFLYYEENILSKKIKSIGKKVVVFNNIKAVHHHSVSIDKNHSSYTKLKVLKESQFYFHSNYSNASKFSLMLLKNSITVLLCLYKMRHGGNKDA